MRKVIGIGETILDIIFRKDSNGEWQPVKSVAGGSTFNSIITLGRLGIDTALITELCNDNVGENILAFLSKYGVATKHIDMYSKEEYSTPISLAYMDENNNAQYQFYHRLPTDNRLNIVIPQINEGDIVIFGSYFSLNPLLHERIIEIIKYAKERKAIIYYDPNFRKNHKGKAIMLMPSVIDNLELADIVRGSDEDFETLYNLNDPPKVYTDKIQFYCPNFIYTQGGKGVKLFTRQGNYHFDTPSIGTPVSTIGAGDTFNAGILFGLIRHNVTLDNINQLSQEQWTQIFKYALDFSAQVCMSQENYLPEEKAAQYL